MWPMILYRARTDRPPWPGGRSAGQGSALVHRAVEQRGGRLGEHSAPVVDILVGALQAPPHFVAAVGQGIEEVVAFQQVAQVAAERQRQACPHIQVSVIGLGSQFFIVAVGYQQIAARGVVIAWKRVG